LVQKFSGKRDNENFNDFLRMLASPSVCRVCAFGVGDAGWKDPRGVQRRADCSRRDVFTLSSSSFFLGNYNRATYRGTVRSFLRFSFIPSLSFSFAPSQPSRSLISFRGNCVYGTTRELQGFVIPWNCGPFVETPGEIGTRPLSQNNRVLVCFSVRLMDFVMKCMF